MRDALRALRSTPIVTAVAILSLALGIGANTAIFSLLNTILLRSLPVRDPERLAVLMLGPDRTSWTNPLWEQLRAHPDVFDGACAWGGTQFNLARGGETQFVNGIMTSGRFFDVLGVPAVLGRTFTDDDDRRGGGSAGPVAVISYAFWQQHFGGAADVIGKPLSVETVPFTIIGVTPPSFSGPTIGIRYDVAIPIGTEPLIRGASQSALDRRGWWWLNVMARLKPGQTFAAATGAFRAIQPQMREATLPGWRPEDLKQYLRAGFEVIPASMGTSFLRRQYEQPLVALMVVVALVLLIACANIANVLLARAIGRRHEMSVRLALGATRGMLLRQLLVESAIVSAAGAVAGLVFARWGSALLVREISTQGRQVFLDLSLDWRVLGFTAGVAMVTALLFGTAPALRASSVAPNDVLKEHGRGAAGDRRFGLLHGLVVGQVALSLVLIVAAGLFVRTFANLTHVPLGFDRGGVIVLDLDARRSTVTPAARLQMYERARDEVAALPGVTAAALSAVTPVSGSIWDETIENPPGLALTEDERDVYANRVSAGWFAAYGTPLLAGRDFDRADTLGAPPVIIVNETFARKFFGGRNPVGQAVREIARPGASTPALHIIGLVKDAVYFSVRRPVPPTMYFAVTQSEDPLTRLSDAGTSISLSVHAATGARGALSKSVAAAIARVDPNVSVTFHSLADEIDGSLTQERIVAMLSAFFGGLALLLAGIGLYGVMSYTVGRRRTEIGIRMALGAGPTSAVASILLRVAVLVGLGIATGAALSLWASGFVGSLLYGLAPRDPAILAGAAVVLVLIAAAAAWVPARRAARIDPAQVLREG